MAAKQQFQPPTDEAGLITWIEAKAQKQQGRLPLYQIKRNIAFTLGQQWMIWDAQARTMRLPQQNPQSPNSVKKLTINKIGSIVERTASKLTKEAIAPECRPASDDQDDISAAKVGTRILTHELARLEWTKKQVEFIFWPIITGCSYWQVSWDATAGPVLDIDPEGKLHQGEVVLDPVPWPELVVDPNADSLRDAIWARRTKAMTREAVWEQWGKEVESDTKPIMDDMLSIANAGGGHMAATSDTADMVAVKQFWSVPCRAFPKGIVITYCGTTVLEKMDFPYKHGRLPFVQQDLLPGIGRREGRTWVTDLIPMQIDYNDARSREADQRNKMSPKLMVPKGAMGSMDEQRASSRVEVYPYSPINGKPDWLIPDSGWLQQHETTMKRADIEMGERSGQSDASTGTAAPTSAAASLIALQEADDTKLATSVKLLAVTVQEIGWHILNLVKQYWTEERTIRTWSEAGDLEAQRFTGADVSDSLDVYVSPESLLPRSKAARQDLVFKLQGAGMLTDVRRALQIIDEPGMDAFMDNLSLDAKQAQRENSHLRNGELQQVHTFDNHVVHIAEHDDFRKSYEYEQLPPEIRSVVDAHVLVHHEQVLGSMQTPVGGAPAAAPGAVPPAPGTPNDPMMMGLEEAMEPQQAAQGQPAFPGDNTGGTGTPPAEDYPERQIRDAVGIGGPGQPGQSPFLGAGQQAATMR